MLTFTLLQVTPTAMAYLAQYDNPNAILLRDGKSVPYPIQKRIIGEKEISESRFQLREGDMLILMSDGVINAGMGKMAGRWRTLFPLLKISIRPIFLRREWPPGS